MIQNYYSHHDFNNIRKFTFFLGWKKREKKRDDNSCNKITSCENKKHKKKVKHFSSFSFEKIYIHTNIDNFPFFAFLYRLLQYSYMEMGFIFYELNTIRQSKWIWLIN